MQSPSHRALALQVALVLTCLVVSTVQAQSGEDLAGSVRFAEANLVGESNLGSHNLGALHLIADRGMPLKGSWSLHASEAVVNWSRVRVTAVGQSPTDPDRPATTAGSPQASAGDVHYSKTFVSSAVVGMGASVLLVPNSDGQLELQASTNYSLAAQPTEGEKWAAGYRSNETARLGNYARPLIQFYETVPGHPVFRSKSPMGGTIRGNFTLYVWEADVNVESANENRTYRSGSWWENATGPGPRGVARDEYWQFLRIRLGDAVLRFDHQGGVAQWVAPRGSSTTNGTVTFTRARGILESGQNRYAANGESFQIQGWVEQRLEASDSSTAELSGTIQANDATLTLEGAAVPKSFGPQSLNVVWTLLAGLGALALVGGVLVGYPRYRAATDWTTQVARAHDAFSQGRYPETIQRARRLLRKLPLDENAWFLYSAGKLALRPGDMKTAREVVEEFEPRMGPMARPAVLAFLLGTAHVRRGDNASALRWIRVALQDPAFVRDYQKNPDWLELRRRVGHRVNGDAAYA